MKKKIHRSLVFLSALFVLSGMSACSPSDSSTPPTQNSGSQNSGSNATTPTEKTLSSIRIDKQPTKTSYYEGETFDPTGMIVTAVYSDNSRSEVKDYTYDKKDPLTLADTTVTITYQDKMATVTIKVLNPYMATIEGEEKDVYRLEAENMNFDGCYVGESGSRSFIERPEGEAGEKTSGGACAASLATAGNTFFAAVNNLKEEQTVDVRIAWGYGSNDNLELDKWVTLGWNGENLKTDYIVQGAGAGNYYGWVIQTIRGLKLEKGDNRLSFLINAVDEEQADGTIKTSSQCPNIDYIEIDLTPSVVEKIEITSMPNKTMYVEGEGFDPTGLVISKVYDDGEKETLLEGEYTLSPNGALTMEDKEVVVSYDSFKVSIPITVVSAEEILESIRVKTMPTKTEYKIGEVFDPTGMEIEAIYSKAGEMIRRDIPLTEVEIVDADRKLTLEDESMTIRYRDKEITLDIEVTAPIDATIKKVGTYLIEAENKINDGISTFIADSSNTVHTETSAYVSGSSVHGIDVGTEIVSYIQVEEEVTVQFFANLCRYEDINVKNTTEFTVDGEPLVSPDLVLGHTPENEWYNFKEADFGTKVLTPGVHELRFKLIASEADENRVPNIDYLKIVASPDAVLENIEVKTQPTKTDYAEYDKLDFSGLEVEAVYSTGDRVLLDNSELSFDAERASYGMDKVTVNYGEFQTSFDIHVDYRTLKDGESFSFEAEWLDRSQIIDDTEENRHGVIENTDLASNGSSLAHIKTGSKLSFSFQVEETMNVSLKAILARYEEILVKDAIKITIDETELTAPDLTLGRTEGNDFYNFKEADFGTRSLEKGVHVVTIDFIGEMAPNADAFVLSASK